MGFSSQCCLEGEGGTEAGVGMAGAPAPSLCCWDWGARWPRWAGLSPPFLQWAEAASADPRSGGQGEKTCLFLISLAGN